jgi:hypothetical protein
LETKHGRGIGLLLVGTRERRIVVAAAEGRREVGVLHSCLSSWVGFCHLWGALSVKCVAGGGTGITTLAAASTPVINSPTYALGDLIYGAHGGSSRRPEPPRPSEMQPY